jgi:hypothetical protein
MQKRYFHRMMAVVLPGLIGLVSLMHAEVAYTEQNLTGNGGVSVTMDGEWAAVGAYEAGVGGTCYVTMYRLDHTTMEWTLHSELGAANGNCNGNKGFGAAISLANGELVVGLKNYDDGPNKNVGAFSAYAYDSAQDSWEPLIERVLADDAQFQSGFGTAVNIQDGFLMVGAPQHDGTAGADTGKVYFYERPANFDNGLPETITVEGNQTGSLFGSAIAGDRTDIVIGAPGYDQGGFTDNGAGFMYVYDGSVPSITWTGSLYGTTDNEALGVQVAHTDPYAIIAGNLRSHGYQYVDVWERDLDVEGTVGGDVSIDSNVSAIAIKGDSVNVYPALGSSFNSYFLPITPTGTVSSKFAEDISLSQNYLLVSEAGSDQVRMYEMPCGYGGTLVENEWAMVSIPCKISGQTVATIFGDDGLGTYDSNWVVYEQNISNYSGKSTDAIKLDLTTSIEQGKSYWIIADANSTWKVDSTASSTRTDLNTTLVPNPNLVAGTYPITLPTADQNVSGEIYAKVMVGNPFSRSFEWSNVQYYSVSDANISLDSAETSNYMDSTAYIYDSASTSGQPYTAVTTTPGVGSKTVPVNKGFWIKILANAQSGDKLLIPLEK